MASDSLITKSIGREVAFLLTTHNTHARTHAHTRAHTHTRTHAHTHTHTHTRTHAHTHAHTHTPRGRWKLSSGSFCTEFLNMAGLRSLCDLRSTPPSSSLITSSLKGISGTGNSWDNICLAFSLCMHGHKDLVHIIIDLSKCALLLLQDNYCIKFYVCIEQHE